MSDDEICGEPTKEGEPCQRPSGFGRDADGGPCSDHVAEHPILRKFTAEKRETILGAAESGAFKTHTAQLAGISFNTLESWLEMGEADEANDLDTDLAEFYCNWQRARGRGAVDTLRECSEEFLAERAYGYTKKERHEHLVDDDVDLDDAEFQFEYENADAE